jgi:hypothetical protein
MQQKERKAPRKNDYQEKQTVNEYIYSKTAGQQKCTKSSPIEKEMQKTHLSMKIRSNDIIDKPRFLVYWLITSLIFENNIIIPPPLDRKRVRRNIEEWISTKDFRFPCSSFLLCCFLLL